MLDYNMLFRWFLDMGLEEASLDHSTFSKNRERLIEHEIAKGFFAGVLNQAKARQLLSDEHFTVDGTLIESWASFKSLKRKDGEPPRPGSDGTGMVDFKGEKRSNKTHESSTDPQAKLMRKGNGQPAKLSFGAHALMENRSGLLVDVAITEATLFEHKAAAPMLDRRRRGGIGGSEPQLAARAGRQQGRIDLPAPGVRAVGHAPAFGKDVQVEGFGRLARTRLEDDQLLGRPARALEAGGGLLERGRAREGDGDGGVILQIAAHALERVHRADARRLQPGRVADPRAQQDLGDAPPRDLDRGLLALAVELEDRLSPLDLVGDLNEDLDPASVGFREHRDRPHALGHSRASHGGERASASRLLGTHCGRA